MSRVAGLSTSKTTLNMHNMIARSYVESRGVFTVEDPGKLAVKANSRRTIDGPFNAVHLLRLHPVSLTISPNIFSLSLATFDESSK